jgi:hypothetical protein
MQDEVRQTRYCNRVWRSPRVYAAGASRSPYDPSATARGEAPAFTRREPHVRPTTLPHPRVEKPPRLRGGCLTFALRPFRNRVWRSPRVYAAGASRSPYDPSASACGEAPAFTRREPHVRPTTLPHPRVEKPPRLRGGSLTFALRPFRNRVWRSPRVYAAGASRSPYDPSASACGEAPAFTRREPHVRPTTLPQPRVEKPPRLRGGSLTFALRPFRIRVWRSPRVYAAGASRSPYDPSASARGEAPAFTRREPHVRPTTLPQPRVEKPPRLRGGSLTFALRPFRNRVWRSPRVYAAGASRSPYDPSATACGEAPAFTRREPHVRPTTLPHPRVEKPPRLRGGSLTFALRPFRAAGLAW